ncbi:MAG: hypothetical protein AAF497_19395 [Planctomycetota bacterium]
MHRVHESVEAERMRNDAASLLNQQAWCWGRDVESKGNLLIRYGFERIEKPAGSKAASIYQIDLSSTSRLVLRGFGVFFGDDRLGGLYVPRFEFLPQLTPNAILSQPAWSTDDLPPRCSPGSDQLENWQQLLLTLVNWITQYEEWIAKSAGESYRRELLIDWNPKTGRVFDGDSMSAAWESVAKSIREHPDCFIPN